ncbi:metallophosphoesterase [Rubrivirga sp. S365]|uniref:Metallophosphoesterase n=1 Tax=Rubrivirga litoralis TaxID=3075598 RepID=A0ABU3BSA9_9BACT|nr:MULTISPECIES: metallophosphoesterase [unclassified Rubrivirga]MDT0632169.1 metallophosphoesterase [Rubrivirga sp. F394]MDT7857063.1 metallophosphoesterase [Rubrivirga sp. S365]
MSDVHFGRISHPRIVDALVDEVNGAGLDLVVVSGDLTQRARTREFVAARAMLDRFDAPVLVVPGNHDVRAWWHNPFARLWRSSKRFRQLVSPDVTPSFAEPGLAAFGLNSAHGWTIKGGRIRPEHVAEMETFFSRQPLDAFRVLVLHHHLLVLEGLDSDEVSRGASRAIGAAQRARVDLVLCGHLHTSHVAPVELSPATAAGGGHRVVIASAGTATSSRGRGVDRDVNFYNWITVEPERFVVQERRFDAGAGRFEAARESTFDRDRRPARSGA